jgi:hypothetical protein
MVNNKINKHDVIFATMTPKEAMEWTGGHDKEKIDHLRKVKAAAHQNEVIKNAVGLAKNKKNFDEDNMKSWVKNTTALNKNPGAFNKEVKKFNMNKHVVDTLNKYEDEPDIQQQVINYSPVKVMPKRSVRPTAKVRPTAIIREPKKEFKIDTDLTNIRGLSKTINDMEEIINSPAPQYKPPKKENLEGIENIIQKKIR